MHSALKSSHSSHYDWINAFRMKSFSSIRTEFCVCKNKDASIYCTFLAFRFRMNERSLLDYYIMIVPDQCAQFCDCISHLFISTQFTNVVSISILISSHILSHHYVHRFQYRKKKTATKYFSIWFLSNSYLMPPRITFQKCLELLLFIGASL